MFIKYAGQKYVDNVSLSVAIMTHPKRAEMVVDVIDQLNISERAVVVVDKDNNRWNTGKRALQSYDQNCSHHLVLQDDIVLAKNFYEKAVEAIQYVPRGIPISLYFGMGMARKSENQTAIFNANQSNASWIIKKTIDWGQALIFQTSIIDDMVKWCDNSGQQNYDTKMSQYFESIGLPCWYSHPSLVDHIGVDSLVPGRVSKNRVAYAFDGSGRVDLSGPAVDIRRPSRRGTK